MIVCHLGLVVVSRKQKFFIDEILFLVFNPNFTSSRSSSNTSTHKHYSMIVHLSTSVIDVDSFLGFEKEDEKVVVHLSNLKGSVGLIFSKTWS